MTCGGGPLGIFGGADSLLPAGGATVFDGFTGDDGGGVTDGLAPLLVDAGPGTLVPLGELDWLAASGDVDANPGAVGCGAELDGWTTRDDAPCRTRSPW